MTKTLALLALLFITSLAAFIRFGTYWPKPIEVVEVSGPKEQQNAHSQKLKILSWNVQFFAGSKKIFFWDVPAASDGVVGPDSLTDPQEVTQTFLDIVKVIKDSAPDVLFLQEVDDGAMRTGKEDQAARLIKTLAQAGVAPYPYKAEALYWKSAFVPHPKIMGAVGMKLVTLSRVPLSPQGTRHQLPIMPHAFPESRFQLKRAILETTVSAGPFKGTKLLNTHLDAFAQGFTTMQEQVDYVLKILKALNDDAIPFVIGGDFNLLTPGNRTHLHPAHQTLYAEQTELQPLLNAFSSFPRVQDTQNAQSRATFFTYHSADKRISHLGPDRTIDYFFYSPQFKNVQGQVFNRPEHHYSDHYPLMAELAF